MKRLILGLALAASMAFPLAAGAQSGPPPERMGSPDHMGPPPEVRAKFEKILADAKAAAYAALAPDHRTKIQAIVAQVVAGTVMPRDAADQIDGVLTADEKRSVLTAAQKAHEEMHAAMGVREMDGPHGGPPPNGPAAPGAPSMAGPPGDHDGNREQHRAPNAGRRLLMMSLTPDQMRALRPKAPPKP